MRYKGQNHEIRVPLDMKETKDSRAIADAFIEAYERLYSFSTDDMIQIVNFGLSAVGDIVFPAITEEEFAGPDGSDAIIGSRWIYQGDGVFADYTLYDRERLRNGNVVKGPAVVEQMDSTTLILAGQKATVDQYLNMVIEREA